MAGGELRVLLASHTPGIEGGGERSLVETVRALAATGMVDPIVTVPADGDLRRQVREMGLRVAIVTTPRWAQLDGEPRHGWWRGVLLRNHVRPLGEWLGFLRRLRPDLVVSQTSTIVLPALASRLVRVPHIWSIGEFMSRSHGLSFALGDRASRRVVQLLSAAVVARSEALRAHLSPPVRRERLHVIRPVLDIPTVADNVIDGGPLRLLVLGRHTPGKSVDVAIAAVAAARDADVQLRIVGRVTPHDREALVGRARALGIADRIEVLDFTSQPERQIEWCNVMLVCSVDEGFGRVTGEALMSGRPVIGARSGATAELVHHDVNGLLVPARDVRALAGAIERLASEPETIRRMSDAARARMRQRFTGAGHAAQYLQVMRSLLEDGGS